MLPLLQLKEFDQYTTTHSMNVAGAVDGAPEFLGLSATDVRTFGIAGPAARPSARSRFRWRSSRSPKLTDEERQ